ncbi:hypothetical protein B0H19DRAFT_1253188 [Mycena capillaripes]|nr:hypothetical protein B0H19DRAFT_1253188 [Mycena capillaripes]
MLSKPSSVAKREAQARYRARSDLAHGPRYAPSNPMLFDRNQEELRRKAREGMARRRAQLSPDETIKYRMTARKDGARYRAENQAMLAEKALVRRARLAIAKDGYEAWTEKYQKRHKGPIPAVLGAQYGAHTIPDPPDVPAQPKRRHAATQTQAADFRHCPTDLLPDVPRPGICTLARQSRVQRSSSLPPSSKLSSLSSTRDGINPNVVERRDPDSANADMKEDA